MIPRAFLTEWRSIAPWPTDAQVEQDLVICRAIVELFSDPLLAREVAFRGGTALHKLHFGTPSRYSEDIDLVQVNPGPIGPVMRSIRGRLDSWLGSPRWKQGEGRVTLYYRFDSETQPATPLKLKVEISTREHFCVLGYRQVRYQLDSSWNSGAAEVLTYPLEELLGTKLRALYQRKKGRDLFDLSEALNRFPNLKTEVVVACFEQYMRQERRHVSRPVFERNLAEKLADEAFWGDVPQLIAAGVAFDPVEAMQRVRSGIISLLADGGSTRRDHPAS
ncbi:MAG: nucleotidyl transferase AbiEii/AbiGii toxin family protein [Candidatus Eisenbacteria bacterium]|nr:nucleotidyl transferase AbiEii/AbiGii toxin family protein [Candidatus Eisenbacteria bacterium]